jgi:hypothetical protein
MNDRRLYLTFSCSPIYSNKTLLYLLVFHEFDGKVCLNSKFPPTLHSTLEIERAILFGEKCVRLYSWLQKKRELSE